MLNLPRQTLIKIKRILTRQQKDVDQQLKSMEKDDPVLSQEVVAEASESGTDSWASDVHARVMAIKNDLVGLSKKITHALSSIKRGTYGKCENCGKQIEAERLKAMPTATLCISCSRKIPKNKK